jgi:hypothetical protein
MHRPASRAGAGRVDVAICPGHDHRTDRRSHGPADRHRDKAIVARQATTEGVDATGDHAMLGQSSDIDLDQRLFRLADRLSAIPSISSDVRHRIEVASMAPSRRRAAAVVSMLAAGALVTAAIFWRGARRQEAMPPAAFVAQLPSLQLDGIMIQQRFAALIDARTVLVCWSFRGGRAVVSPDLKGRSAAVRHAGYVEIPMRNVAGAKGDTICWSLFVANSSSAQRDNPPTLRVEAAGEQVGFGATPKHYPLMELSGAIASACRDSGGAIGINEVQSLAKMYERDSDIK